MLRMKVFICDVCGYGDEFCVHVEDADPRHCKKPMRYIVEAPAVHYKPHYSHGLGKAVESFKQEEKALEAKGQWIATKSEANSIYETDVFKSDMTIRPLEKAKIKRDVERTAQQLVKDGVISHGYNGWKHSGSSS